MPFDRTEAEEAGRATFSIISCIALWFALRSTRAAERIGSLRETEGDRRDEDDGEGGGGMEAALDRRARGVFIVRERVGVPVGGPIDPPTRPAFGVYGDPVVRVEEARPKVDCIGEAIRFVVVGLLTVLLLGLLAPDTRLLNCFAVIPTYLEAREPGVIIDSMPVFLPCGAMLRLVMVVVLVRVAGGPPPGVRRPDDADGVTLPVASPGVARPLDPAGVLRPLALVEADSDGVARPLRDEATDDGLEIEPAPTVGDDNFDAAMKTPQFGAQVKYRFPLTEPSFLPLPANPPLSSTPANNPAFPSISPRKRNVPSNPRDSIRTLSPISKVRPARLELLANTSLARLAGLG